MCDSWVGWLIKIAQEAMGAAMESVTLYVSTRLGRGSAIALKKRGPFSNCPQSVGEHNLLESECL